MIKSLLMTLALSLATLSIAQGAQLTFEDYGKLPELSMVEISPSGKRVAYRRVQGDRDMLLVIDLTTNKLIRGVDVTSVKPDNMYFIDDDRIMMVVSKNSRIAGYRGRHDISVAFSYDLKTNNLFQVMTAGYGIYTGQSQLGNVIGVSPDKDFAYMLAWKGQSERSLLKVSLTKRRKPRTYKKGTRDTIDFFVNSNGKVLARERFNDKKNRHTLQALQYDEWVTIYQKDTEIRNVGFNGVTPDGKSLLMSRHNNQTGRWDYHTIALKDGAISEAVFSRTDRDVESVLTDINRVVYGVRYSGFKPSYEFFEPTLNARLAGVDAALPNNAMYVTSYTPDWSSIVFNMEGSESSGTYLKYNSGKLALLATARSTIAYDQVHTVEISEFKARDGLPIPTLLTKPLNTEHKNLPAIMMPHGGPESYDYIHFDWLAQYFANQGYVVIQPQFRGSDGFGTAHKFKGRGEWGQKMQDDLTDAVNVYAKQGLINPERVCIVGASYGGYAALAGATFTPDVYQCVVSINGVSDIDRMMRTERRQYGKDHWVVAYWEKIIAQGELDDDHIGKISPINAVKAITAPVLLIHGEHDSVVNVRQSRNMFDEMEDQKKDVTYVELEDGDHHLSMAKNRISAMEAISVFVNKHLK